MSIDRMIIRVAVGIVAVVLVLAVVLRADEVESIASVETKARLFASIFKSRKSAWVSNEGSRQTLTICCWGS